MTVMNRRDFLYGMSGALVGGARALPVEGAVTERPDARDSFMISNVSVFDSARGVLVPDQTVVIQDDVIAAVGTGVRDDSFDVTRIDGRGKYLLPGLIDAHVHLSHILYQSHMTGDEILPFFLAHGVTSVRSTGDNVPAQRLVQRHAERTPHTSPRVFMASFLIGGSPAHHPDVGWSLDKPEDVPEFVAHMAAWGVTTLKLYINVAPEVGRRVIEEGHRHGLMVAGHLTSYHPSDAIRDGIDSLEHIYTVADFIRRDPDDRHSVDLRSDAAKRLIDQIAESQVFVDPTLMVFWGTLFFVDDPQVIEHADNASMPRRLLDFWHLDNPRRLDSFSSGPIAVRRGTFQTYMELVGLLHRAGARVLVGTDAPEPQVPPGSSLHHEMEFLVQSGMSPAEVLSAATLVNARVLKADDRIGSVTPGKKADLVLLDANPLTDIRNTRRISHVFKDGAALLPAEILTAAPR